MNSFMNRCAGRAIVALFVLTLAGLAFGGNPPQGSSSGGGSVTWPLTATNYLDMDGSDIRNSGDLAAKSNVYGITGFGTITFPTGGSGGPHIVGPSDDGFTVTAGAGRPLNLVADNGNGAVVQIHNDGHIELNAAGSNQDIQLSPSGTGKVVATNLNGSVLATGHIYRLGTVYGGANDLAVLPGDCRSALDDANIVLAAKATISIGAANGAGGLNARVLHPTITATTHGTATFEPSASIATALKPRAGDGTLTTSGTTFSSTGDEDLAVGDLVGSSTTYGWSRVATITGAYSEATGSGCAGTLAAALPGGDATGITFTICENATIWPGTTVADKRRIKTLSAAGTSVVLDAAVASSAAGVNLTIGVEVASCWYPVHVGNVSGSPTAFLSTQRRAPYTMTGLTASRWIGVVYNNSSGNIVPFSCDGAGSTVSYTWECDSGGTFGLALRVVNGGTTDAAWHRIALTDAVPPGCGRVYCSSQVAASGTAFLRPSGVGDAAAARRNFVLSPAAGQMNNKPWVQLSGGAFDYATDQALYLDVYGFDFQR